MCIFCKGKDILRYPNTIVEGTRFADYLERMIDHKIRLAQIKLADDPDWELIMKVELLANELGYKWQKGGNWTKGGDNK